MGQAAGAHLVTSRGMKGGKKPESGGRAGATGANVVRLEAEALRRLAERLAGPMGEPFERAVEMLNACTGRVVVTGMGKSGLVARKVAATLASTGTPSLFLHPAEAVHGDLGMVTRGDTVLALSDSGETEELLRLLAMLKRLQAGLVAMTGNVRSTLGQAADVALDCSIPPEAAALGLAPTASTTAMMALGDALALALAEKKGFKEEDFANLHPGGKLGKRLARVSALMHSGEAVPRVAPGTRMPEVIYEMSRKKLGMTAVVEGERLVGVISDGDLRRLLEKRGKDAIAAAALSLMEEKKITALAVVDGEGRLEGIVHLHDLWGTQMV
jgi:arabinose-5-phosphate isomerase